MTHSIFNISTRAFTIFLLVALSSGAGALAQQPAPASPPPPASTAPATSNPPAAAPPPAPNPEPAFKDADALLRALETAGTDIRSLKADVRYLRNFGGIEGGNAEDRRGELMFRSTPAREGAKDASPERSFVVDFTTLLVNDQKRDERRTFIFDGVWLVEKDWGQKQFTKRRVVPPGEGQRADPLRIGEGPFPVPIGQKRDDILARFEATLLPAADGLPEGPAQKSFADTVQLRLVPRAATDEARDFKEVRLWYRTGTLLPRMARTVNTDGGSTEVILLNVVTNQPLPDGVFDTATPGTDQGWNVDVREFRQRVDEKKE